MLLGRPLRGRARPAGPPNCRRSPPRSATAALRRHRPSAQRQIAVILRQRARRCRGVWRAHPPKRTTMTVIQPRTSFLRLSTRDSGARLVLAKGGHRRAWGGIVTVDQTSASTSSARSGAASGTESDHMSSPSSAGVRRMAPGVIGASVPCLEASASVCVSGLGGRPSQSRVIIVIVSLLVS